MLTFFRVRLHPLALKINSYRGQAPLKDITAQISIVDLNISANKPANY